MANLYLIKQSVNGNTDTYESAVVCADDPVSASGLHPNSTAIYNWVDSEKELETWCRPIDVVVIGLGVANFDVPYGVVCASFNAG